MPSVSFAYDSGFDPAMPVMEVTVAGVRRGSPSAQVVAQVDSGADATMLPFDLLQRVGARYYETRMMRSVTGHRLAVDTYLETVQVGPHRIAGVEAVGMMGSTESILGRDVLNQLEITLHGPAHEVWVT